MIVLAIGILGLVGLQYNALKNGNNAQFRYQATLLAYEMSERMRANPLGVDAGHYNNISYASSYSSPGSLGAATMFQHDLAEWKQNLDDSLPNGEGSIDASPLVAGAFTINVRWSQSEGQGTGGATDSISLVVRM